MNPLIVSADFERTIRNVRSRKDRRAIWAKVTELKERAPIGKKLVGNPYWSLRVGRYRVIYQLRDDAVLLGPVLEREHEYRDV